MVMRWGGALMVLIGIGIVFAPPWIGVLLAGLQAEHQVQLDPLYCAVVGGFAFLSGWVLIGAAVAIDKMEHHRRSTRRRLDMIERHTAATSASTQEIAAAGMALADALTRGDARQGAPARASQRD